MTNPSDSEHSVVKALKSHGCELGMPEPSHDQPAYEGDG